MSKVRWLVFLLGGWSTVPAVAQEAAPGLEASGTGFLVLRGSDTLAVESYTRGPVELSGTLLRGTGPAAGDRVRYHAVLAEDESAPLVELSVWRRADDPERLKARQTSRIIFRDDSVAVDDMTGTGLRTLVMPTARAAIPYLHLSVALLEQATRRAAADTSESLAMPVFNLGGGQTLPGVVRRLGGDSMLVTIALVEFRLQVDPAGAILGGELPALGMRFVRTGAR